MTTNSTRNINTISGIRMDKRGKGRIMLLRGMSSFFLTSFATAYTEIYLSPHLNHADGFDTNGEMAAG